VHAAFVTKNAGKRSGLAEIAARVLAEVFSELAEIVS
jgi:hypothetical protein